MPGSYQQKGLLCCPRSGVDLCLPCCGVQLKDLLLATYFTADHVVWAFQIGLIQDKTVGERAQKVSLWGWALGSVLTMIIEANNIVSVSEHNESTK